MSSRLGLQIINHKSQTSVSKSSYKHMAMYLLAHFLNDQCKSFAALP